MAAVDSTAKTASIQTIERSCPLCETVNSQVPAHRYSDPFWRLKQCPQCDFVYIENAPRYEHMSSDLAWEKTFQVEEQRRKATRGHEYTLSKNTRWRMALLPRKKFPALLRQHARPGNVIDIGCGNGAQMLGLERAFVPHGIEVSAELSQQAQQVFQSLGGFVVHAPSLEGLQQCASDYFSAATLRSYLEHEMYPQPVLKEIFRILQPGGVALIKVPNYGSLNRRIMGRDWCGFRFPDHLNYFTPATLKAMALRVGFIVKYGLTYKLPTSDNMYIRLIKPA